MLEVSPVRDRDESARALYGIGQCFGPPSYLDIDRVHAAFDGGEIVGGAGAFAYELTVPGGSLPCAGVTIDGGYPTHRRRRVLREMMRPARRRVRGLGSRSRRCGRSRRRSTAASATASRRGPARSSCAATGARSRGRWSGAGRRASSRRMRHRRCSRRCTTRCGASGRASPRARTNGGSSVSASTRASRRAVDVEAGGSGRARNDAAGDRGDLAVPARPRLDAHDRGGTAAARPSAVPLLANARRAGYRVMDALWLRLVDVGAALSGREYSSGASLVFEVRDAFCPWNEGRWKLEAGTAARTDEAASSRSTSTRSAPRSSALCRSRRCATRCGSRSSWTARFSGRRVVRVAAAALVPRDLLS